MPKPKKFILNDEAVANSYGFFILTEGGKLDRFKDNPVMLSDHVNKNENVIGKWLNIEVKGGKISAEPDFDIARPLAADIAGQVEREYLKGASMGIIPNWNSMERIGDKLLLKEWELAEASIVPVPSNRNSIAIYSADGKLLQEDEVKNLCLSFQELTEKPELNFKNNNMKKILLSIPALMALGYKDQPTDGLDSHDVDSKIIELSGKVKSLTEENDSLKLAAETAKKEKEEQQKASVTKKVDLAISQGKFKADQKEEMVKLGLTSESALDTVIGSIGPKQNFSAGLTTFSGTNAFSEVKTMDDFEKLSHEQKLSFKNESPEAYKQIFNQ